MATKQIRVTQTGSPIGRHRRQRANLIGLGLNKISRSKILSDTPEVRGRIGQVHHLVRVDPVDQPEPSASVKRQRQGKRQAPAAGPAPRTEKAEP